MKQLTASLLVLSLLLSLAGCSAAGMARSLDTAEDRLEEKLDTAEDSVERTVRRALIPEPAESVFEPVTKDRAEQIALDHLGLSKNQVSRLHTEYEIDDGVGHYDVQFRSGDWEYEFEIHAETGRILACDKDSKYD